jgi:hypothetical protein
MLLTVSLQDIYALEDEMRYYERKYGVLSETFYESYMAGEEPFTRCVLKRPITRL